MSNFQLAYLNFPECPQEPLSSHAAKTFNNGQALNTTKRPSCSAVNTGGSRLGSKPAGVKGIRHKSLFDVSPVKCPMPSPCLDLFIQIQGKAQFQAVPSSSTPLLCPSPIRGSTSGLQPLQALSQTQ